MSHIPWVTHRVHRHDVEQAYVRVREHVHQTPVLSSRALNHMCGAEELGGLFFKCENLQRTGSFKIRGAMNAVLALSQDDAEKGVVTHSSGNHAQALALAAAVRKISATVVMPDNAPAIKRRAVEEYGARVVLCAPTLEAREAACATIVANTGATFVPPYNHEMVMAGQGTLALELDASHPNLDAIVVPVGGGGMISGVAAYFHGSKTRVIGAEPAAASDAWESKQNGTIASAKNTFTIADGLRTSLGSLTFPIVRDWVESITLIEENDIRQSQRLIMERMKLVIEPSAGVSVAAAMTLLRAHNTWRIGVVLCGGNVDLDARPWRVEG